MSAQVIPFRPRPPRQRALDPGGFRYIRASSDPITLGVALFIGLAALGLAAGCFFLGRMGG